MSDQDLWFERVDLLSRCSLNEGLLWVWAQRVPVFNAYRETNVFDSLQDWECERLFREGSDGAPVQRSD
jgi:hypothetical protein